MQLRDAFVRGVWIDLSAARGDGSCGVSEYFIEGAGDSVRRETCRICEDVREYKRYYIF